MLTVTNKWDCTEENKTKILVLFLRVPMKSVIFFVLLIQI